MEPCNEHQIPSYLHAQGREKIDPLPLAEDDKVCIRVKPQDWDAEADRPQVTAFVTTKQSCNLSGLCTDINDVLFDHNCPDKCWVHWGVVSLNCKAVEAKPFSVDGQPARNYRPLVVHDPLPCNYPHCEIHYLHQQDAATFPVRVEEIKPTSVKLAIRKYYSDHCKVEKQPNPLA